MVARGLLRRGLLWLMLSALAVGCDGRGSPIPPQPSTSPTSEVARPPIDYEALRTRSQRSFSRAALLLPDNKFRDSAGFWMSPLLLVELADEPVADDDFPRFGPLITNAIGQCEVASGENPGVYLHQSQTSIDGQAYEQLIHLWFYPSADDTQAPYFLGVRQILDEHGFGILWESLYPDAEVREFYIAESLEEAAAAEFGPPLPGRHFSIETPLEEHPEVTVIRDVGEGPQPMGPFAYVDRSAQTLTTLRCRCEPPQIDQYGPTLNYQLLRVDDLESLLPGTDLDEARLDGRFRWPSPASEK